VYHFCRGLQKYISTGNKSLSTSVGMNINEQKEEALNYNIKCNAYMYTPSLKINNKVNYIITHHPK